MALRPLSRKAACCATVAASLRLHARYIQKCRFWIFCKSTVCEVFKTDTGNSRRAAHENKHLTLSFFSCNFIELLKRFAWKNSLSQIPFAKFDHKIVTILPLLFPDAFCRKVGQQFCTTFGGMFSCRFRSTFLSSYNYFWYELCRSNTHCTGN